MTGRIVEVPIRPKRIISLVPSQTELLYDLGLNNEVVGITKFCVHPDEWFRSKPRVGGTKQVHIDIIKNLQPDLVLANKEENTEEIVNEIAAFCPVWVSDIQTLDDALTMIREVGAMTHTIESASMITRQIVNGFDALPANVPGKKVAYFIWRKPWMCAGGDTFISNMLLHMGWQNVLAGKLRYPEIELAELKALQPELILLSSEPYPFKEAHMAEIKAAVPGAEILLVDGEMFSWYGSRLRLAPGYFGELMNSRS